ncbi:MAG: hypothetical protein M0P73_16990 [Syntrophobacterales bacterium]|jgi:hypothetical protein|nr:hypothetical protein [Syntrophobacterales bacterium]
MFKVADRKDENLTTVVQINPKDGFYESQSFSADKDYRKLLEDKIKEKKLNLENNEVEMKGSSRENLQKKRKWMSEVVKPILEIKDILERTGLVEIRLMYRNKKVTSNDLKNIIIKSTEYDESQIVKSGFKLDIDFCPRSAALNNKRDCFLVQLLGKTTEPEILKKYYSLDSLMEFIINYCSEYIAAFSDQG